MISTSVVNGTLGPAGVVTFSAVASVSLNGCFTTEFDNYLIVLDATGSTNASVNMVKRLAGVDNTSSNYDSQVLAGSNVTASASQGVALAAWAPTAAATILHKARIELMSPALAVATMGIATAFGTLNPMTAAATTGVSVKGVLFRSATACDGFTFTPSAGTFGGTIRVYGYNNN